MIESGATIEWRAGPRYAMAITVVHALAGFAVATIAQRWPIAWTLLSLVVASAAFDATRVVRECRRSHRLGCTPLGLALDGVDCEVRDAWLALGWTVLWLRGPRGPTRLLYVHRSELTRAQFAALRRHVKSLDFS
jgi:hypothetical protein